MAAAYTLLYSKLNIYVCVFAPFATVTATTAGNEMPRKLVSVLRSAARSGQTLYPNSARLWLGQNKDLTAATFVVQQLAAAVIAAAAAAAGVFGK